MKRNDELIAAKKKVQFFQGLLDAHSKGTILEQYSIINSLQSNPSAIQPKTENGTISETKRIHLNEIANYDKRIKQELLSTKWVDKMADKNDKLNMNKNKNYEDIIKYHELLQEKVTNEMVTLVQNLKQNLTTSNEIVKKDTELLEKTNQFTESNVSNLRKNTDKIREFASAACEYWLWISLTLVIFSFLFMVIFIRLFPKKATIIVINNIAGQSQIDQQHSHHDNQRVEL